MGQTEIWAYKVDFTCISVASTGESVGVGKILLCSLKSCLCNGFDVQTSQIATTIIRKLLWKMLDHGHEIL